MDTDETPQDVLAILEERNQACRERDEALAQVADLVRSLGDAHARELYLNAALHEALSRPNHALAA